MEEKLHTFLQSGLLERYLVGDTSIAENLEVEYQIDNHSEIEDAYIKLQNNLEILAKANVSEDKKVQDWNDDEISGIRDAVSYFKIEGELRSEIQLNIKRLMDIGCQRGIRHRAGLPLRGQRTKNNSRTRKGKRKTVANKKKATK